LEKRLRKHRDGGGLDGSASPVVREIRALTRIVTETMRVHAARTPSVAELAGVAATYLRDPAVAPILRGADRPARLRGRVVETPTQITAEARYALLPPTGLTIAARVIGSYRGGSARTLTDPAILLVRELSNRVLNWLRGHAARITPRGPADPLLVLT